MTQDEYDDTFQKAIKKFSNHKNFQNVLKDFNVKVDANKNISEFSTEIQPEKDLAEYTKRLVSAKLAIYNLLYRLEREDKERNKGEDTSLFDKLLDRVVVIALTKAIFEDEPGTCCPTEEE